MDKKTNKKLTLINQIGIKKDKKKVEYLLYPIIFLITITAKSLELTNNDPRLKLTKIVCKAETIYSFSQRR